MRAAAVLLLVLASCVRRPAPDALYGGAETLLKQGKLKEALTRADQGLHADPSWRFRLLKAEVLLSSGQARNALAILESAEAPPSGESRARRAMHRGQAKYLLSDYAEAEAALEEAGALARPLRLPLLDAEIALRRGLLMVRQGRSALAEQTFRGVLQTASALGDLYLEASATGNLGFLFLNTYRYDEAIYWLERARGAFQGLGSTASVAKALGNLGWCYFRLGDDDRALADFTAAQARFHAAGNRYEEQIWLGNIGAVLLRREQYREAIAKYASALEIARSLGDKYSTAWWLNNLALASIDLGDFDAAKRYNSEALLLKQSLPDRSDFYPRVNEAEIAAGRNDAAGAEKLYREVLADPPADPTPVLNAESGLAELFVKTGDLDRADAQFRSTIAGIESRRGALAGDDYKLSYLASLIRFYQRYVDLLVQRGQSGRALEIAESSRARLLEERLGSGETQRGVARVAEFRQLARTSKSVLLFYWLAPTRSFLWVVTAERITLHVLPPERQIDSLVEGYRSFVESLRDPLDSEYPAGRRLSEILLKPVLPLLVPGVRVIAVPDRGLSALNLETLPDPGDPSRYLIDRATVSVAPSLGLLVNARRGRPARRSILIIGDPEPAGEEYPRLPYAAREMELIGRNFPPQQKRVLQGAQAYPAAYRDAEPGRFSWIHFAAHAEAHHDNALDSALILTRRESGYTLSARDVMNVALNADLVTLSACRSAGAKAYSGEGLVGLSWAFLRAGARSVVAGLWDVTDLSTAVLMADFYAQLSNNAAPAEALRRAKLGLIRSAGAYRKPFYWGPFQLYVGSARSLRVN